MPIPLYLSYIDDITWVKQTVNRRMAKGHGYYLQHAKETCLVGKKGDDPSGTRRSVASDVIFSERRGQSQKPEELYEMIEELVPDGKCRESNLIDGVCWASVFCLCWLSVCIQENTLKYLAARTTCVIIGSQSGTSYENTGPACIPFHEG